MRISMGGEKRTTGWILFQRVAAITMVTAGHTSWFIYAAFATHTLPSKTKGYSVARSLCHSLALLFPLSQTHYIHQSRPMFGMCTMDIRIVFHECCVAMRLQHLPGLLYYLVFAAFVRSLYSLCMYTSYTQKLNMKSFLWGNADTIRCRCSDVDMLCFYILYFVWCVLRVERNHTRIFHLQFSVFVSCF